jgi:hypothetical protein
MPQIEEAQFVNWGSMRPDIIPLAAPGITMAVGPNGSGKSCWLDGLKIILGVSDLSGRRTPGSYVFNGGPSGLPAEQAWLRATFANPVHSGQRHRVFAFAGGGCERAEHITVVCRIRGDRRQYVVLPGRIAWGLDNSIEDDLVALQGRLPESKWLGSQNYDRILTRAGVTKALRGVLALPQGETNRLVAEPPTGLMRRLLELTGRQDTLDKFRLAKAKHDEATIAHRDAQRRFELKTINVERLGVQVRQHREFIRDRTRLADIVDLLLPAALHYESLEALSDIKEDIAKKQGVRGQRETELTALCDVRGQMGEFLDLAASTAESATWRRTELADQLSEANELYGQTRERAVIAWRALSEARTTAGTTSLHQTNHDVQVAESAFGAAVGRYQQLGLERAQSQQDHDRIRNGESMAPREVRAFQQHLQSVGIHTMIVGDALEEVTGNTNHADHAQAALGSALWALVTPVDRYREACIHAADAKYTWPLAPEGTGTPHGVLDLGAHEALGLILETLDATAATSMGQVDQLNTDGAAATTSNGTRYDPAISWPTPIQDQVLHPQARASTITQHDVAVAHARDEQNAVELELPSLRSQLIAAYATRDSFQRLEDTRRVFRLAGRAFAHVVVGRRWLQDQHSTASTDEKAALDEVNGKNVEIADQNARIAAKKEAITTLDSEIQALERNRLKCELLLVDRPLPTGFVPMYLERLAPSPNLQAERDRLQSDIDDLNRYPADVKDPVIVDQHVAEEERLSGVADLINGKGAELEERARVVEAARQRYYDHIRALVRELKNKFTEICATAGVEGTILLIPGDIQDEYGVDVLVAHKTGETPLSYRDGSHSGGQGTKIAILLLLAAMSLGQNADLLIVDEHKAHLDGTNSSQITEVMRSLATRVQFVLSAPTVPKYDREEADWCDVQVTFLPRDSGDTHSPPVRLMSRLDAVHLAYRFESLEQPLI